MNSKKKKSKENKIRRVEKGECSGQKESNEKKNERKMSLYAKERDVRIAFYASRPIFILVCKETYLNVSNIDPNLPSSTIAFL